MKLLAPPLILLALLSALWSGWLRLGWTLPVSHLAGTHGNLMVNSFLATLIFLERAVTFRRRWVLLLPVVNGSSVLAFFAGQHHLASCLLIAGSAGFVVMCLYFLYTYREFYYLIFLAGATCLLAGNIQLLLRNQYPEVIGWWWGFLLFTIVAERLELSKFLPLGRTQRIALLLSLGIFLTALFLPVGMAHPVLAVGLATTGAWLLRYDMARRSIRATGQHAYSGWLLLAGFAWLLITGALLIFQGSLVFAYDALLHSFFIGFVFSMIFSHAPIILPGILRKPVKIYHPLLYTWFILLQASLLIRIICDAIGEGEGRKLAGLVNGIVILLFFATVAVRTGKQVRLQ